MSKNKENLDNISQMFLNACISNSTEELQTLINNYKEAGGDLRTIFKIRNEYGSTPLIAMCVYCNLKEIKLFLKTYAEAGGNPSDIINGKEHSGDTPLSYSFANGHTEAVRLLLNNGGNLDELFINEELFSKDRVEQVIAGLHDPDFNFNCLNYKTSSGNTIYDVLIKYDTSILLKLRDNCNLDASIRNMLGFTNEYNDE